MLLWKPTGSLDVATDPAELPQQSDGQGNVQSGALSRCKNLRLDLAGVIKTRDGSAKVNATALAQKLIWKIVEQAGVRYTFAGTVLYRNEVSIATGLTSAPWSAVKYNPFNSSTQSIYALNGTDRKRIEGSTAYEWGIEPPADAPTMSAPFYYCTASWETVGSSVALATQTGVQFTRANTSPAINYLFDWEASHLGGTCTDATEDSVDERDMWDSGLGGLTGSYNYKYTYCRKEGTTVVSESNPSPAADAASTLENGLARVSFTPSADPQVTHVRIYRTVASGADYYHLADAAVGTTSYDDTTEDGALGSEVETDHDRPPAGVFVAGPSYNGTLFILKDNRLYFSRAKQPDYWPLAYYIEISPLQDPGVAINFVGGQPVCLTKHRIVQIQGTGPDTFFPLPLEAVTGAQGISAALSVAGQGIFHAGTDGVYLFNGTDRKISQAAFDPLFRGESAGGLPGMTDPSTSWVFQFRNRLYCGYTSSGYAYPSNVLVINLDTRRESYFTWGREIRTLCHDEYNDRLLAGDSSGFIWVLEDSTATTDGGTAIAWEVQGKDFGLQTRTQFPAGVKYDVNSSGATGAKGEMLLDGAVHQTHALSDNRSTKKRLVAGGNGKRVALRLSGTGPVAIYAAEIL